MKSAALLTGLALFAAQLAYCLEPGAQAPELATSKTIQGKTPSLAALKGKSPCVIEFFASWSDDGVGALKNLAGLKRKFAKSGLEVFAISTDQEKDVPALKGKLKRLSGVDVALDDNGSCEAAYMSSEPLLPLFFIVDKNGSIVWKGSAQDMPFVLERFLAGKFTAQDSKRVEALRKDVAAALKAKDIAKVVEASDALLDILPADMDTVRLRLALFQLQGGSTLAAEFLDKLVAKAPGSEALLFCKLETLLHGDSKADAKGLAEFAAKAFEAFKDSPEDLNNLAWILIDESEFGCAPLEIALKASKLSVETLPADADPDMRAAGLDTLARIMHILGDDAKALELQNKALELWKGSDDEARCQRVVDFYKKIIELAKTAK